LAQTDPAIGVVRGSAMASQKPFLFAAACGLTAFAALPACSRAPSRAASGEEIAAAVEHAERELAEANAMRQFEPTNEPLATALPY
jgi:hypothetical protein